MKLLENPLIKIIGIVVVLYFALFANKHNPQSLGNRLSAERIKKNLGDIEEKGKFIASNVRAAQSYSKAHEGSVPNALNSQENISNQGGALVTKDIDVGIGKKPVACGDEVEVFVTLNAGKSKNLDIKPEAKFVIGSKKDWLLEKNILGMEKGGVREISVPHDFKASDSELARFLKENNSDLTYQIILKEILKESKSQTNLNCE